MSNWLSTTLGEVISTGGGLIQTGPFGSQLHASDYVDVGIPCIMPTNMLENRVDLNGIARISEKDAKRLSRHLVEEGDIVYSRRGDVTQKALIRESEAGFFCGTGCLLVRPGKAVDPEFLVYYLSTSAIKDWLVNQSVGGTMPNLNTGILAKVPLRIPDRTSQRQIASILSALDAKITLNQRINVELEAMAKLLYDYWFVQFDFPMSAAQAKRLGKPKLEGKPYKSSGGRMVYDPELKREVPEGWEAGTLSDLGTVVGGSTPSTIKAELFTRNGTAWITPKDLSNNLGNRFITRGGTDVSELGIASTSLKVMPPGTVLLSTRAPIGYMAIAREQVTTNQGFKSFVPNKGYSTEFIFETVRRCMPAIIGQSAGTTFKEVSKADLSALKTPLPPKALVDDATELLVPLFKQQNVLELQNQELASLRDWLLPMLMNGQVRVAEAEQKVSIAIAAEPQARYGSHAAPKKLSMEDRAALNGWIIHVSSRNLVTRTKAEKIEHMIESVVGFDHQRDAVRDAAGPIDIKSRKATENKMAELGYGWVEPQETQRGRTMQKYHKGKRIQEAVTRTEAYFGSHLTEALRIVDLMRLKTIHECEVYATLYAAWNDLLHFGKPTSDKDIIYASSYDWHERKVEIEHEDWLKGLKWLRDNNLVPTGNAKPVRAK